MTLLWIEQNELSIKSSCLAVGLGNNVENLQCDYYSKDIAIIANIVVEHFAVLDKAEHHPTVVA